MDDLRWILLTVGSVIIAAIYFSSRFESEDWLREREERKIREAAAKGKAETKKSPRIQPKINTQSKRSDATREPAFIPESHDSENTNQIEISIEKAEEDSQRLKASEASSKTVRPDSPVVEKKVVERKEPEFVPSPNIPVDDLIADEALPITGRPDDIANDISMTSSIEDEIVTIEMPMDLVEAELKVKQEQYDPMINEPIQGPFPLGIDPLVLIVTVVAEEGQNFTGLEIQEALSQEGLEFGDMKIFHYHVDGHKEAVFSVANVIEPGFIDIKKIAELETPGLSVFCQLPGPLSGNEALDIMLDKGRGIAVRLHGRMCDDKRNMFTAQAATHYKDRIASFNHELALAHKKGL